MKSFSFVLVILWLFFCEGCVKKNEAEDSTPVLTDYRVVFEGKYTCSGTESHYFPPSDNKPVITKDTIISIVVTALNDSSVQFNLHLNPYAKVNTAGLYSGYHFSGQFYAQDSLFIQYMDGGLGEGHTYTLHGRKIK